MVTFNPRQQAAVAFPCNTVVNASAGTGKTATLVGAYLSRLAQQIPPGQILAITFTEKAAAEMRDRLKREVLARASVPPRDGAPEVDSISIEKRTRACEWRSRRRAGRADGRF